MPAKKGVRGRRFESGLAPEAAALNGSIGFDWRLLPYDIAGSIAHARMLGAKRIISVEDADQIIAGLEQVQKKLAADPDFDPNLEDIHMNVEAKLTNEIGTAGGRLHTGRSRNDQVATDLRLYARAAAQTITNHLIALQRALVAQAEANIDTFMPGYTHLQRAQPVRLAHHLLAYVAMFARDRERVEDAAQRACECPLGSGALAATPFAIDRQQVAEELGFDSVTRNSMDAAGDRDFVIELVSHLGLCQVHLSRLGEEIVLWMSQEFRFATTSHRYCSGSSIMPQKVNPDLAELVRAKTGRVIGDWVSLMTVLKGLPLAYNKDLQETQEPLYDAVETVEASLEVMTGMIQSLTFDPKRLRQAVDEGYVVATEVADYLVEKGCPFREAHDVAGALVRKAIEAKVELSGLPLAVFQAENAAFEPDIFEWLDVGRAIDRRNVVGGPARHQITAELARLRSELE